MTGVAWSDRRSVRYIPTVAEVTEAPYGLAVTVDGAPGQSRDVWQRYCGRLSSTLRVREVAVAEPKPGHSNCNCACAIRSARPMRFHRFRVHADGSCRSASTSKAAGLRNPAAI